jgi:hypothetical protein
MVVVALSPSSLLPVSTPASSCSQRQLECCRSGGPRRTGGAVMVGVFAALPVPRQSSSSSCGGPVVPLSVAPLSALRAWLTAVVGGAVSHGRGRGPVPLHIVVAGLIVPVVSWSGWSWWQW